jgi:opacity protein-like surface antigen
MPSIARLCFRLAACGTLLTAIPRVTQAQGAAGGAYRPVSVWLGVGASTPISDFKELAKSGQTAQGAVQYRPDGKSLGVRGELQFHKMDMTPEFLAEEGASAGVTGTWSVLYGGVSAVLESMPKGRSFGWYLLAGGGSYRVEPSIEDAGISQSATKTQFGFNGGAGLRFKVGGVGLFLEGRYHTVTIEDSKVTLLPVSVGIVF